MSNKKAAFFIGSGVSRDSKAPMISALTDSVVNGQWQAHSDETFIPLTHKNPHIPNQLAERAQEMIRRLHVRIEKHIAERDGRAPHYEDYFSCLWQIVQDETAEVPNPLLADFVATFRPQTEDLWKPEHAHISVIAGSQAVPNPFASLADNATRLIQWVVYHCLSGVSVPVNLALLTESVKTFGETDIFSLNHDLLVERLLDREGIAFADGFGEADGDAKLFNWSWNNTTAPARLFKLHGSINWYLFRFESRNVDQYAKISGNPDYGKDSTGKRLLSLSNSPRFLTGTTVKEQSYGTDIFGELFHQFRKRLANYNNLVCSGYGWEDKGINIRINQWLRDNRDNRVIILHGMTGEALETKRFWWTRWDRYEKAGKLVRVPAWLGECEMKDIEPFLV